MVPPTQAVGRRQRPALDQAEAPEGDEGEAHQDLGPAVEPAEAVAVAGVGHRPRQLVVVDAEGAAGLGEAGRLEGVAPVQDREGRLDRLLHEPQHDEENEQEGHPTS